VLQARIAGVMRRTARAMERTEPVGVGTHTIDLAAHRVEVAGREVALTRKEYDLLAALCRRPGAVVTRDELLADVWHTTWSGNRHTVEVHVGSLRTKLGDPRVVQTVRGVGYRLRTQDPGE
jgi:DNA-binding response OmpR family regulator